LAAIPVDDSILILHVQLLQEYGLDFTYLLNDLLSEKPKIPLKLDSTFSFNSHNRLSKHPSQLASSSITPKAPTNGRRTQTQNTNSPSIGTPPVPALPSYLKQPKSAVPSSRSSDSDRVPSSPLLKPSDRAPTPSSKLSDRAPTPQSLKPDRAPTPQSHKSSERIPTPLDLGTTDPPLIFPLTSPSSPYTSFPHSAASADVFTTFGTMLSSPGANGQAVFSIPSRSGARTPVSSKEPSKSLGPPPSSQSYVSPLSSPAPPNIPRTPVKMPSSASLNAGAGAGAGAGATTSASSGGGGLLSARAPPRALRVGVPPTPARSTSRLAGHRPPPVAVPPHDGMF